MSPIGYGAMRLTGPGIFGPPPHVGGALRLLREAVEAGVDHIDTSEYYGPHVVTSSSARRSGPYPPQLVLVSKVGARRDSRGGIFPYDAPTQLREAIEENLGTLAIESLPVVTLRLMRPGAPDSLVDERIGSMVAARDAGLIQAIGLSNVALAHVSRALELTDVACVQSSYHPQDRRSQPVLEVCARRGIAFVPFSPLGSGSRGPGSALDDGAVRRVAVRLRCTLRLRSRWHGRCRPHRTSS
ncbi:aldo/keto reductase [Nocardioides sp.]|uniref:aldo/keto reductase n=1 Tax=Nocardioides sp. TaxID=35761 RepID=UPI0039C99737